jgi:hypothetical protein
MLVRSDLSLRIIDTRFYLVAACTQNVKRNQYWHGYCFLENRWQGAGIMGEVVLAN